MIEMSKTVCSICEWLFLKNSLFHSTTINSILCCEFTYECYMLNKIINKIKLFEMVCSVHNLMLFKQCQWKKILSIAFLITTRDKWEYWWHFALSISIDVLFNPTTVDFKHDIFNSYVECSLVNLIIICKYSFH